MRALCLEGSTPTVRERAEPRSTAGRAILRMRLAGICNTDLEIARGYMGFQGILGHEGVGEVIEGPAEWLGKRAASEINFGCGRCPSCEQGLERHCPQREVMGILDADGTFAEYVSVPITNLHAIPDALDDERATFVEPLAAAFEVIEQLGDVSGQTAAVLGDGKLGLLVAQVLDMCGARVLAVGRHRDHLEILSRRGIQTCEADAFRPADSPGRDIVVEATGSANALSGAIAATRPRGKLVLKTTVADPLTIDLAPIVINEIEVVGSRCGPFSPAIEALATDQIDVTSLIAGTFPLSAATDALAQAARRGVGKVLIDCDSD